MSSVDNNVSMEWMVKTGQVRIAKEMPRKVLGRRDRRKLATREALLDAIQALLASRSMDALSVDEIVERADVAKGTFYNYFADKNALELELGGRMRVPAFSARLKRLRYAERSGALYTNLQV